MSTTAFARINGFTPTFNGLSAGLTLEIMFMGPGVPDAPMNGSAEVPLTGAETVQEIRSKMTTAIYDLAAAFALPQVVSMALPAFQKGS